MLQANVFRFVKTDLMGFYFFIEKSSIHASAMFMTHSFLFLQSEYEDV